jgi:hypothetical protein
MMNGLDLRELDRSVLEASRAFLAWRRQARTADRELIRLDPFPGRRAISSRATFLKLSSLPPEWPDREPLLRWVAALTLDRVTFEDIADLEISRRVERHPVRDLGAETWNVRDLCLESVLHPEPDRRAAAARGLLDGCDDVSSNALFWVARRHEAARQLGLPGLRWLEVPLASDLQVPTAVASVLEATREVAEESVGGAGQWQDALHQGAAIEAVEGWPAQLNGRWLYELLRHTGLMEGVQVQLDALPQARTGASFARAMDRFGTAVYRAHARRITGAFALAVQPFDPRPARYGALFASLLASPLFLRKHLGLGQIAARTQARALTRSLVLAIRNLAVQAAVAASDEVRLAREQHMELATRALCVQVPTELAGVLPRCRPTACSRLVGALAAAVLADQLTEQHDEDWFDNPRAHQQLRELDVTTRLVLDDKQLPEAAGCFARQCAEVLD